MSIKVVTWGTGNVGCYAVRAVLNHPELELVGHIVSSATIRAGRRLVGRVGGVMRRVGNG